MLRTLRSDLEIELGYRADTSVSESQENAKGDTEETVEEIGEVIGVAQEGFVSFSAFSSSQSSRMQVQSHSLPSHLPARKHTARASRQGH